MKSILILPIIAGLASTGWAQTTYFSEDFNTGVIPPTGWVNQNNNAGPNYGWELGNLNGFAAWHDDTTGANDYTLGSVDFDLSAASVAYLHLQQGIVFASWRDHHYIDASTDGWVTSVNLADDLAGDGVSSLTVDLSSYAGTAGVAVGFHYTGDFASEWSVDDILVNDSATAPPPPLSNWPVSVPTAFAPGAGMEDFESHAGTFPAHMASNELDSTFSPDPDAYCQINGSSGFGAASGSFCLEMGLDPFSNYYHYVNNALVVGVNGAPTALSIDFSAIDHGDEVDGFDGMWISQDGVNWANVLTDWWSAPYLSWGTMTGITLADPRIDTTQNFYLMFAQTDNFPYAYLDGIGIDDIDFGGGPTGPALAVNNLVGGMTADIALSGCTPGGISYFAYSLVGGGPINSPYGTAYVSPPYQVFPLLVDPAGDAGMSANVPPHASGASIWFHGADANSATMTNPIATTIG